MYLLAAIPFALAAFWLVVLVLRLRALRARLRANLAGCAGYPISPGSRRPALCPGTSHLALPSVPLRSVARGRAAERFGGAS